MHDMRVCDETVKQRSPRPSDLGGRGDELLVGAIQLGDCRAHDVIDPAATQGAQELICRNAHLAIGGREEERGKQQGTCQSERKAG